MDFPTTLSYLFTRRINGPSIPARNSRKASNRRFRSKSCSNAKRSSKQIKRCRNWLRLSVCVFYFWLHFLRLHATTQGVLPEQIFCDGWSIGYDERYPQKKRIQQALIFARFSEHDNLYAHPLVHLILNNSSSRLLMFRIN